jgi:FkbM family methyltransferase
MRFPENVTNLAEHLNTLGFIEREWACPSRKLSFDILKEDGKIYTVVDIGAYIGYFIEICLKQLPMITMVVSFEPNQQNNRILQYNWDEQSTVSLVQIPEGIFYGKTEGQLLGINDGNPGGCIFEGVPLAHLEPHAKRLYKYAGIVKMTTLEAQLDGVPDLIKMDVEGSEYNIIENSVLLKQTRYLMIDFHGHSTEYLQKYLKTYLPMFSIKYLGTDGFGESYHNYAFLIREEQ